MLHTGQRSINFIVNMDAKAEAADSKSADRNGKMKRENETECEETHTKKSKSISSIAVADVRKLIEFMSLVGELKRVPRTGWVRKKVKDPESVSDHMYRMAVMAMLIPTSDSLNKDRCIKIALVHDMAECIVGDITPWDGITKEEKHKLEDEAMKRLSGLVGEETGKELFDLWEEYEYQRSDEARFVKDLDKFEMILQAHEYEKQQLGTDGLQEFFDSTEGKFHHPTVQGWVQGLHEVRKDSKNMPENTDDGVADDQTNDLPTTS